MDESPDRRQHNRPSRSRRLETPARGSRSRRKSRTRSPTQDEAPCQKRMRSRSNLRERGRSQQEISLERVRLLEDQLLREREKILHAAENRTRSQSHRSRQHPGTSAIRNQQDEDERHHKMKEDDQQRRAERRNAAEHRERSRSLSLSKKDLFDVLNYFKTSLTSHSTGEARPLPKIDHMNILPNFDPSVKNQRVDVWIKKVNECASVYGWDDRTTSHFALQKLQGLAKIWYEGLSSVLFDWPQWQQKLLNAFPCEQNYGQALEDMLKRRSRFNEPIENYFYEKLTLLNMCDIDGKRAVDCIIHGITDRTLKSGALALRCAHPDQLLQYLMSSKESSQSVDRHQIRNRPIITNNNNNINNQRPGNKFPSPSGCYNCKEKGHSFLFCPKPLIKCSQCNLVGHTADNCTTKNSFKNVKTNDVPKTLCIESVDQRKDSVPKSKFVKEVAINGEIFEAFVDFGSDVTLIRESVLSKLGLEHDGRPTLMKGFGNSVVRSLGGLALNFNIDNVEAVVSCKVVTDNLLEKPVLIGQTFTEQAHIIVYKDATKLQFLHVGNELPLTDSVANCDAVLAIKTNDVLELFGAATIRARIEPPFSGTVLVNSTRGGKPNQQYFVCGGLHQAQNGVVDLTVVPCSDLCCIPASSILCRAEQVTVVNRVVTAPSEVSNILQKDFNECEVRVGDNITQDVKECLFETLRKFKHCFASSLRELGCTNTTEMTIELNSERPVVYRPYRLSHHERENVRSMVTEMLDADIIRQSTSSYASPILLVRKKDGTFRLCIDYRMLNSITVKERYPMPIIEDEIARLSGQACFITLDLASGYYQVPISEKSKHLTAFVTPDGQYEFNRMPFGLANAPAVFQRMINSILGACRFNKATAYIDDILIFGRDVNECLERLTDVLRMIEKAGLTLNLSKCDFLKSKIDYLGYEISADGVRPGEKKILSVMNFPQPKNVHNVRQFLGLASYFRKFMKDFAQTAYPLSKLLKKDAAWEWGEIQEQAFTKLKTLLVERPVLAIFDPNAETELHTDASRVGIGGILLQRSNKDESLRPVAFYSRQTSPEEKNFHSYELETLAVVCSLRKFRVYLLGKQFKIVTDCSALRSTFTKRDLIPRIARWWLSLQEFDCSIEYRAGVKMSHVDALSRNPIADSDQPLIEQFPSVMSISGEDWLYTLQLGDSELCRIRDILTNDLDEKGLRYIKDNYVMQDNKLYRVVGGETRWVVPKGARWQICRMNHDDIGHFGMEKTLERIKRNYWFAKMTKFVKKYVNSCIECAYAKNNSNKREGLLHPIEKFEKPFHTLHIDHLGPFVKSKRGYSYLLIIIDAFTKFCLVKPVRNTNTQNALRVLDDVFYTFRTPERLVSDRGSCFTSHAFKRFCLDKGTKHILNAVASPRSNGQVERYNRTILDSMKALAVKHGEKDWDGFLGQIQWGLNNTIQKTIGRTPSEVLFGTPMNGEKNPIMNEICTESIGKNNITALRDEVKQKIDQEQEKQKECYDKGRKPSRKFKEGDLVKVTKISYNNDGQSKKMMPTYVGPYRVSQVLGNDRYRLAPIPGLSGTQNKRTTTVAADRIMPWIHLAALEVHEQESDTSDIEQDA